MPTEHDTQRADRLLAKMHRVLSHDLPNQVVALQGLLQILEMEEGDRLGDEGRECVTRLHRVVRKANGMIRFLKEMTRLNGYHGRLEHMAAAVLLREIRTELQQQLPAAPLHCEVASTVLSVPVDPRRLALAVVEIVRCLVERFPGSRALLLLRMAAAESGTELHGELRWPTPGARPNDTPDRPRLEQSLEIILAEELLAVWEAHLTEVREEADMSRFTIVWPEACAHG